MTRRGTADRLLGELFGLTGLRVGRGGVHCGQVSKIDKAEPSHDVTQLLLDWEAGRQDAVEPLMRRVYDELHKRAVGFLRGERSEHTLQATALVHEAYVRLVDQKRVCWQNRSHFYGVAASMMRRILVDHARKHGAVKRGGDAVVFSLDDFLGVPDLHQPDMVTLDLALQGLEKISERATRAVELRFFVGLSISQTADILGVSPATVKKDWVRAKAWLYRELHREDRDGG